MVDLKEEYASYLDSVSGSQEGFLIASDSLPLKADVITTDAFFIRKGIHPYDTSMLVDMLLFHGVSEIYQCLGLCIFSLLFCNKKHSIDIEITHPNSEVKTFKIIKPFHDTSNLEAGYHSIPYCYMYYPDDLGNGYSVDGRSDLFLPHIKLTNEDGSATLINDKENRDVLVVGDTCEGIASFASLLINFGHPSNEGVELALENYLGNYALSKKSAEVILNLPGSDWWDED